MLLYVPQETQCTKLKLPLALESAFPEEAGLVTAGALLIPEALDGDLADILGGIVESWLQQRVISISTQRAAGRLVSIGVLASLHAP